MRTLTLKNFLKSHDKLTWIHHKNIIPMVFIVFINNTYTMTNQYQIGIANRTDRYLSIKCFPSQQSASISPAHNYYCDYNDTNVYFGRFDNNSNEDSLNTIVNQELDAALYDCTGYHYMQNNHAWQIRKVYVDSEVKSLLLTITGDPTLTIEGCWSNN